MLVHPQLGFTTSDCGDDGEGCTPGYWKNPKHFDSWLYYTPDQKFCDVTDISGAVSIACCLDDLTLLDVLKLKGNQFGALGRVAKHTVASLLNAAYNLDFGYSTTSIVSLYNDVCDGDKDAIEALKNELDELNNQGCPLN